MNVVFQANQKRPFLIVEGYSVPMFQRYNVTVTQIRMVESKKATIPVFIQ